MKCKYLDEVTGSKGVIFATGTPISNSMTEMYTMMRYLQGNLLKQKRLEHFDCWASTFGETVTSLELAPEGNSYRARTRFSKFFNLPELMKMFKEVADIQTSDMLDLPVPKLNLYNVIVPPTEFQLEMVEELSQRAVKVRVDRIDPRIDNMLKIVGDGRKIGLDPRIINPIIPDDESTKINVCVKKVMNIWTKTRTQKLTQLIFCDISTPNGARDEDGEKAFNVYDDMKVKFIKNGVPEREIAFIHDADSETKRKTLFAKFRKGEVRILLGSTPKLGAGTNIQDKLIALHDLDAPWRPADLAQRLGRIVRQGNTNPEVHVFRYATEKTFDAYLYQTLENKQKFISQIMTSKSPARTCDDIDESVLSYSEIKALCAGNPLIKEKMDLDIEVTKLKMLKANHQSIIYELEDNLLKAFPYKKRMISDIIYGIEKDISQLKGQVKNVDDFYPMVLGSNTYFEKDNAAVALGDIIKEIKLGVDDKFIGEYRGFKMFIGYQSLKEFYFRLKNNSTIITKLGNSQLANITRIDTVIDNLPDELEKNKRNLSDLFVQIENAKKEVKREFPKENELKEKSGRLKELDVLLSEPDNVKKDLVVKSKDKTMDL